MAYFLQITQALFLIHFKLYIKDLWYSHIYYVNHCYIVLFREQEKQNPHVQYTQTTLDLYNMFMFSIIGLWNTRFQNQLTKTFK